MRSESFFPKNKVATVILILGTLTLVLVLWYPIAQTFLWSFLDKFMLSSKFVGLKNYDKMLTDDPLFWQSIRNTIVYTLMIVPITVVIGLFLAVIVNTVTNRFLRGVFSSAYFIAYVVPVVAVSVVWRYMFEPSSIGFFNALLINIGIGPIRWLIHPDTALASIAMVSIWKRIGYVLLIYIAGLQSIPEVYHEAAKIDGASRWQRFRHITLPLLAPVTLFVIVMSTISALMMFTETFVMTSVSGGTLPGGPLGSTTSMVLYIFQSAFSYQKEGYASAIAVALFLIVFVITVTQLKVIEGRQENE